VRSPANERFRDNVAARFVMALFGAVVVTAVLLVLMVLMVVSRGEVPDTRGRYKIADIWQPERTLTELAKASRPKRPSEPAMILPTMPRENLHFNMPTAAIRLQAAPMPTVRLNIGLGSGDFARDTDYIPVYVPLPLYPRRALARGRQGYAVVEVVITTTGGVRDVKLLEESPRNYGFGSAARKAALKLKYNPRVIDGQGVEVPGVMYKFTFRLE